MRFSSTLAALCLIGAIAGCAEPAPPPPAPRPLPPRPAPPPPPPPPPATSDWRYAPLTPGDWRYQADSNGSEAIFASAGAGIFTVRCERAGQSIVLTRFAGGGARLRITTTYGSRVLNGRPEGNGVAATLAANDSLLDSIAFSRGRFTVESESGAMLVLPSWPEPARVIEDCRGQD